MSTTSTTQSGKSATQDLAETGKQAAKDAAAATKHQAEEALQTAKADLEQRATSTKASVADDVSNVAGALREAAEKLRDGSPQERTMSQIANGFADASDAIRGKDFSEMVEDVNAFARRNPAVFLGAAAMIGFTASRFGKASSTRSGRMTSPRSSTFSAPMPSKSAVDTPSVVTPTPGQNPGSIGRTHAQSVSDGGSTS